ncbi:MAG: Rne/Rng family ribonuclease [Planctomycetota bacterium]|nr:MAG: Rne/Rng family ribonuclease [Planctomycetota bacterium]
MAAPQIKPISKESLATARVMLINVTEGEECRIAVLHQNRLEELFIERSTSESHVGNIYKGRVTNVEPSIQAAFVDFGLPKNGFLHISDLRPQYFPEGKGQPENVGRKTPRRERPPIQKCLRRGQEVIVQIIKEGIGTKGPTLTTYISIPGRYLVMMPGMNRLGVSRKIDDDESRRKMRKVLEEMKLPQGMGFILRTAGLAKSKRELRNDLMYLQRLWKLVAERTKTEQAPCELYQESNLVIRTIRDVYSSDFDRIIVDSETTAKKVRDFLSIAMPRSAAPVEVYESRRPLFHEYEIESEIVRINERYVPLKSGGSLVIDSTEALVAIDVNSGRFRDLQDAEQTAYRINLEAAEEIARQLRLRDLGGLILCDFIDMRLDKHRRGIEKALRDALRKHKERAKCLRMSSFGIIEMTRQRMRPSIKRSIYQDCPHCGGSGLVKNPESMTLDIIRLLHLAVHHNQVKRVEIRVAPEVAFQLQNRKRSTIRSLEEETSRRIIVHADGNMGLDQYVFECFDRRGGAIRVVEPLEETQAFVETQTKRHKLSNGDGVVESTETLEEVLE